MPIPKAKRIQVLREYHDQYERKKKFGAIQLEWDGNPEHEDVMVYETHRNRKDHFHRNLQAWAVSTEIWAELKDMGVDKIRIISRPVRDALHENEVFEIDMKKALKCGEVTSSGDYEPQFFIPESCFYDPEKVWF